MESIKVETVYKSREIKVMALLGTLELREGLGVKGKCGEIPTHMGIS